MQVNSDRKIEYVIFDMDGKVVPLQVPLTCAYQLSDVATQGLMIDSERVYTQVTNDILAVYGKEMTWDIKSGLMGKPEREAAQHLLSFFPDIDLTIDSYLRQRDAAQDLLWPHVQPLPGVVRLVQHLHAHGIPMAIATGTRRRNFALKTGHLQEEIFGLFNGRIVCGDDAVPVCEGQRKLKGKPDPDIFLVAARTKLDRPVGEQDGSYSERLERAKGLIFEDAIPGVQAGKRAGMSVVWVPDPNLLNVEYTGAEKADQVLKSIEEFVPEYWGLPPYKS